jgi:hypothetical protein
MKTTLLFAIDPATEETIVSESAKGSYQIQPIERIPRASHELLYDAVSFLSRMAQSADLDAAAFKAMDKVCTLLYAQHKGN